MTKFQRVYEAAVFKTLGANTRTIAQMLLFEYGLLGRSPARSDRFAPSRSPGASAGLRSRSPGGSLDEHVIAALRSPLIVAIGVVSSLDVLRHKPLATLRAE